MPQKHIFVVHGRSTKPRFEQKLRYTTESLTHGLERVGETAAAKSINGTVKLTLAYYGDINNRLMLKAKPEMSKDMMPVGNEWYEKDGCDDAPMKDLKLRPLEKHTADEYEHLKRVTQDRAAVDDMARFFSPMAALFGLSKKVICKMLPDLGAYLTSRVVASEVRQRLQGPLHDALAAGDDVLLVGHSMGAIVSYDVLWKFSHMSEYAAMKPKRLRWLTLGSPLGEPAVRGSLYDYGEPEDGQFPRNVTRWTNVTARDDFVAHDATAADDFKEMTTKQYVQRLDDVAVQTFWVNQNQSNPHKLYGYLNHPEVARIIARWINGND